LLHLEDFLGGQLTDLRYQDHLELWRWLGRVMVQDVNEQATMAWLYARLAPRIKPLVAGVTYKDVFADITLEGLAIEIFNTPDLRAPAATTVRPVATPSVAPAPARQGPQGDRTVPIPIAIGAWKDTLRDYMSDRNNFCSICFATYHGATECPLFW
jgi:hypothetical protein